MGRVVRCVRTVLGGARTPLSLLSRLRLCWVWSSRCGVDFGLEDVCDPGCGGAKGYGCQSFECSRWLVLGQSFVHDRRDLLLCDSFDGVGDAKLFFPVEFVPQSWSAAESTGCTKGAGAWGPHGRTGCGDAGGSVGV